MAAWFTLHWRALPTLCSTQLTCGILAHRWNSKFVFLNPPSSSQTHNQSRQLCVWKIWLRKSKGVKHALNAFFWQGPNCNFSHLSCKDHVYVLDEWFAGRQIENMQASGDVQHRKQLERLTSENMDNMELRHVLQSCLGMHAFFDNSWVKLGSCTWRMLAFMCAWIYTLAWLGRRAGDGVNEISDIPKYLKSLKEQLERVRTVKSSRKHSYRPQANACVHINSMPQAHTPKISSFISRKIKAWKESNFMLWAPWTLCCAHSDT